MNFPQRLYVKDPFDSSSNPTFEGQETLQRVTTGDTVAVYELRATCKVREETKRAIFLDLPSGAVYLEITDISNRPSPILERKVVDDDIPY